MPKKGGGERPRRTTGKFIVVFKFMTSYLIILGMIAEEGLESGGVNGRLSWPKQRDSLSATHLPQT